jgi:hypothetical protein
MFWLIAGLIVLLVIGSIGHARDRKHQAVQAAKLAECSARLRTLAQLGQLSSIDVAAHGYRPVSGEILFGVCTTAQPAEERSSSKNGLGRLLVTNKAIVFEGRDKNERFTLAQIATVELFKDGFVLKRRNGKHRAFRTGGDPEFLALVDAVTFA